MGEPVGSGDRWDRVDDARRECGDQHRCRFHAQDFGDHVAINMRSRMRRRPPHGTARDAGFARRCWKRPIGVPNRGGPRQARVKKGLTAPHGQNFDAGAWRGGFGCATGCGLRPGPDFSDHGWLEMATRLAPFAPCGRGVTRWAMLPQDEFRSEDHPISGKDRRGNGLPVRVRHHERLVKLATPQGAAKRRVNLRHKASGGVGAGLSQVSPKRRPSHGKIVY